MLKPKASLLILRGALLQQKADLLMLRRALLKPKASLLKLRRVLLQQKTDLPLSQTSQKWRRDLHQVQKLLRFQRNLVKLT